MNSAATAFCQAQGFTTAPSFLIRPDFPEETVIPFHPFTSPKTKTKNQPPITKLIK